MSFRMDGAFWASMQKKLMQTSSLFFLNSSAVRSRPIFRFTASAVLGMRTNLVSTPTRDLVMSTYVVSSLPSGAGNPWGTRYLRQRSYSVGWRNGAIGRNWGIMSYTKLDG